MREEGLAGGPDLASGDETFAGLPTKDPLDDGLEGGGCGADGFLGGGGPIEERGGGGENARDAVGGVPAGLAAGIPLEGGAKLLLGCQPGTRGAAGDVANVVVCVCVGL